MASIQLSRYEAEEGDLPDVCMCCGAPAIERKRRRFISHPLWVYVLLPFGYIPYMIVASVLTEDVPCHTRFCSRHKKYWRNRALAIWGGFFAIVALIVGSFALVGSVIPEPPKAVQDWLFGLLCFGSLFLLLCWLISIPVVQLTAIHPSDVTRRGLTLKRISPAFAEALQEYREKRQSDEALEAEPVEERNRFDIRRAPPGRRDLG